MNSIERETPWKASRREEAPVRRGWLKHGNPPGDLSTVRRCGAKNRRQTPCRAPAMKNGRCKFHGGMSTGPRTPEGLERSRRTRWKHGAYSRETKAILRVVGVGASCWRCSLERLPCRSSGEQAPQVSFELLKRLWRISASLCHCCCEPVPSRSLSRCVP
jgi:hypothetical protein